jgi:hypothetical protein
MYLDVGVEPKQADTCRQDEHRGALKGHAESIITRIRPASIYV